MAECPKCGEPIGDFDDVTERPLWSGQYYHTKCAEQQDIEDECHKEISEALEFIVARVEKVVFFTPDPFGIHSMEMYLPRVKRHPCSRGRRKSLVFHGGHLRGILLKAHIAVRDLPPIAAPNPLADEEAEAERLLDNCVKDFRRDNDAEKEQVAG